MKQKNIIFVGLIMFVASLFLFLGIDTGSLPSTYFELNEGAVVSITLGREVSLKSESDDFLIFLAPPSGTTDAAIFSVTFFSTGGGTQKFDKTVKKNDYFSWSPTIPHEHLIPMTTDEIHINVEIGTINIGEITIIENGQKVELNRAAITIQNLTGQNASQDTRLFLDEQASYSTKSSEGLKPHEKSLAAEILNASQKTTPTLAFFLISLSTKIFGFNLGGLRFVTALSRLLSILVVFLLGKKLFKSDTFATIFASLAAFEGVSHLTAKTLCLEPIMALFVLLAFYFLLNYIDKSQKKPTGLKPVVWPLLSGVALAFAVGVSPVALFYLLPLAAIWLLDTLQKIKLHKNGDTRVQTTSAETKEQVSKNPTKLLVALGGGLLILPVLLSLIWLLPFGAVSTLLGINLSFTAIYFLGVFVAVFFTLLTLTNKSAQKNTVIYLLAFLLCTYLPMIFIPSFSFAAHCYFASIFILGFVTLAAKNWIEASQGQITLGKFAIKKSVAICCLVLVLFAVYFALSISGLLGTLWL